MTDNIPNFVLNLSVFLYYQFATFILGFLAYPFKRSLEEAGRWNIFAFWLVGFNVMAGVMILLGFFGRISLSSILALNLLFWAIVFLRRKFIIEGVSRFARFRIKGALNKDYAVFKPLLAILILVMFFSCFVPPTKIDDISYGIYYTKKVAIDGVFKPFYSPCAALLYMAAPVYNIWPYIHGAEQAAALNSFFYFLISVVLIFVWAHANFGRRVAILGSVSVIFSFYKVICCIAPGDNSLNFLLLAVFMAVSYDMHVSMCKSPGPLVTGEAHARLFLLYLLFFTSLAVKLTSILLTAPALIFFYLFHLNKMPFTRRHLYLFACALGLFSPLLLKSYLLYGNPVFPLLSNIWGSGPFESAALKRGFASHFAISAIGAPKGLPGLLMSPFLYIRKDAIFMLLNPLPWALALFGFFRLFRTKAMYAFFSIVLCYVTAFYAASHYFPRFYLGLIDFLAILGMAEFFKLMPQRFRERSAEMVKAAVLFAAIAVTCAAVVYTYQFTSAFFTNQKRDDFIRPRVDCYETIRWANRNLPGNCLLITPTIGRYYYDVDTEALCPTVFGNGRSVIRNDRAFYELLKSNGVTHLMTVKGSADVYVKTPYAAFCQNPEFSEPVYRNDREIILAGRWMKPFYGRTAIYRLK